MSGNNIIYGTILFLLMTLVSPFSAIAASCDIADVGGSQSCIGVITNPKVDSESWFNTYDGSGAFGIDQWVFAEKIQNSDDPAIPPVRETETYVGLNITPDVDGEQYFGSWSLSGDIFDHYLKVALVLKAGPEFSTYLLDGSSTSGAWDIRNWASSGLSHASVYVVQAVPIPAAMWLFVSGLFGMLTLTRRKISIL